MRTPSRPRIAIDLVPIHAGRGGAGGGIWSYASALVAGLDAIVTPDVEIICLSRPDQALPRLDRVRRVEFPLAPGSPVRRLEWIHRRLPAWCSRNDVAVVHKLATEGPWRGGTTRLVTTVQDFMAEFYREGLGVGVSAGGGTALAGLQRRYFEAATRRCFARSAVVLTTTRSVAAEARRRYPAAAGRIRTVPLGVDHDALAREAPPAAADAAEATDAADLRPRLLCVGAFLPHKRQHLAVSALERLLAAAPERFAGTTLTLRGHPADPAYHARVRAAAAASPAAAAIRLAGYEPDAPPAARYRDADLLLQLSAYEGFGLPPLEAQAAGLPVVCADIPVFREVLGDGALFVAVDHPEAVATAIARVAGDPALRASLVARGHANSARFSWSRTARETLAVYAALLEGAGGGVRRASDRSPATSTPSPPPLRS